MAIVSARPLLSRGGSVDAMELFQNFAGHAPQIEPLLEKAWPDRDSGNAKTLSALRRAMTHRSLVCYRRALPLSRLWETGIQQIQRHVQAITVAGSPFDVETGRTQILDALPHRCAYAPLIACSAVPK